MAQGFSMTPAQWAWLFQQMGMPVAGTSSQDVEPTPIPAATDPGRPSTIATGGEPPAPGINIPGPNVDPNQLNLLGLTGSREAFIGSGLDPRTGQPLTGLPDVQQITPWWAGPGSGTAPTASDTLGTGLVDVTEPGDDAPPPAELSNTPTSAPELPPGYGGPGSYPPPVYGPPTLPDVPEPAGLSFMPLPPDIPQDFSPSETPSGIAPNPFASPVPPTGSITDIPGGNVPLNPPQGPPGPPDTGSVVYGPPLDSNVPEAPTDTTTTPDDTSGVPVAPPGYTIDPTTGIPVVSYVPPGDPGLYQGWPNQLTIPQQLSLPTQYPNLTGINIPDIFTNDPTPNIAPSGFPMGSITPDAVARTTPLAGAFTGIGSGGGGILTNSWQRAMGLHPLSPAAFNWFASQGGPGGGYSPQMRAQYAAYLANPHQYVLNMLAAMSQSGSGTSGPDTGPPSGGAQAHGTPPTHPG